MLLPVAFILGIWSGEDLSTLLGLSNGALAMMGICLVSAILIPRGVLQRCLFPIGVVGLLVAGHQIGSHSSKTAFNECFRSGESVRKDLAGYRSRTGAFPETLEAMGKPLPGGRLLRGSLLEYHREGDGYELSFGDHWVSHRATSSSAFHAHK